MRNISILIIVSFLFGSCFPNEKITCCYYMKIKKKQNSADPRGSICFDSIGYNYTVTKGSVRMGEGSFNYKGSYVQKSIFVNLYSEGHKVKKMLKMGNKRIYDIGWNHFYVYNTKYKFKRRVLGTDN